MAIIVKKSKTYLWPITILEPVDGGLFVRTTVDMYLNMIDQDRINKIIADAKKGDGNIDGDDDAIAPPDTDVVDEVFAKWGPDAFMDESGQPLLFSAENKKAILSVPYIRTGIMKGFFESISGKKPARLKN